jgi:hypothetical protein
MLPEYCQYNFQLFQQFEIENSEYIDFQSEAVKQDSDSISIEFLFWLGEGIENELNQITMLTKCPGSLFLTVRKSNSHFKRFLKSQENKKCSIPYRQFKQLWLVKMINTIHQLSKLKLYDSINNEDFTISAITSTGSCEACFLNLPPIQKDSCSRACNSIFRYDQENVLFIYEINAEKGNQY